MMPLACPFKRVKSFVQFLRKPKEIFVSSVRSVFTNESVVPVKSRTEAVLCSSDVQNKLGDRLETTILKKKRKTKKPMYTEFDVVLLMGLDNTRRPGRTTIHVFFALAEGRMLAKSLELQARITCAMCEVARGQTDIETMLTEDCETRRVLIEVLAELPDPEDPIKDGYRYNLIKRLKVVRKH